MKARRCDRRAPTIVSSSSRHESGPQARFTALGGQENQRRWAGAKCCCSFSRIALKQNTSLHSASSERTIRRGGLPKPRRSHRRRMCRPCSAGGRPLQSFRFCSTKPPKYNVWSTTGAVPRETPGPLGVQLRLPDQRRPRSRLREGEGGRRGPCLANSRQGPQSCPIPAIRQSSVAAFPASIDSKQQAEIANTVASGGSRPGVFTLSRGRRQSQDLTVGRRQLLRAPLLLEPPEPGGVIPRPSTPIRDAPRSRQVLPSGPLVPEGEIGRKCKIGKLGPNVPYLRLEQSLQPTRCVRCRASIRHATFTPPPREPRTFPPTIASYSRWE